MALPHELEIYKQADKLLGLALEVQVNIPRTFRTALGQKISGECIEILVLIARANAARGEGRVYHIECLRERLDVAIFLLRASHGKQLISHKLWARSIELTDSIGKQASGWLKAARGSASSAPAA